MVYYIMLKYCQPPFSPSEVYYASPAAQGAFPKGPRAVPLNTIAREDAALWPP